MTDVCARISGTLRPLLPDHLERLPAQDDRSRAILRQMQADEIRHAEAAEARGGVELPWPLPRLNHRDHRRTEKSERQRKQRH